jgi:hypothetical protein
VGAFLAMRFAGPNELREFRPYIGADPGATGAFGLVWDNWCAVYPVPTDPKAVAGTSVDDMALLALARELATVGPVLAVLEHVWGMAGQGAGGSFTFGDTTGAMRIALKAAGIRVERASAQRWRNRLGVSGDKAQSVAMAIKLFPGNADLFTPRRKVRTAAQCEGNAEAVLIAEFARREYAGEGVKC